MNVTFAATYFDGKNLTPHPVTAELSAGVLKIAGVDASMEFPTSQIFVSDRVADVPRFFHLSSGASLETDDNAAIDRYLAGVKTARLQALVHWLENHSQIAAVAAIAVVITVVCLVQFGLPVLARKVAAAVPAKIERQADDVSLAAIDRFYVPTELTNIEKLTVVAQMSRLPFPGGMKNVRFQFRKMGVQPNAFALPGGTLVISDELVRLGTKDELAAVVAHELGHVHHKHGMQSLLRSSAALLVLSALTGDLSALTASSAALPLTLLQRGYSREFEEEADAYAVELLKKASIDPAHFASILEKLDQTRPAGVDVSYLSTHPATEERIKRINPSGTRITAAKDHRVEPVQTIVPDPNNPNQSVQQLLESFSAPKKLTDFTPLDRPPKAKYQPGPQYPSAMSIAGVEGSVVVEFIIDANGNVGNCKIVRSTHTAFEDAAIKSVQSWKFEPARMDNKNVAVLVSQLLEFNLENNDQSSAGPK